MTFWIRRPVCGLRSQHYFGMRKSDGIRTRYTGRACRAVAGAPTARTAQTVPLYPQGDKSPPLGARPSGHFWEAPERAWLCAERRRCALSHSEGPKLPSEWPCGMPYPHTSGRTSSRSAARSCALRAIAAQYAPRAGSYCPCILSIDHQIRPQDYFLYGVDPPVRALPFAHGLVMGQQERRG